MLASMSGYSLLLDNLDLGSLLYPYFSRLGLTLYFNLISTVCIVNNTNRVSISNRSIIFSIVGRVNMRLIDYRIRDLIPYYSISLFTDSIRLVNSRIGSIIRLTIRFNTNSTYSIIIF